MGTPQPIHLMGKSSRNNNAAKKTFRNMLLIRDFEKSPLFLHIYFSDFIVYPIILGHSVYQKYVLPGIIVIRLKSIRFLLNMPVKEV